MRRDETKSPSGGLPLHRIHLGGISLFRTILRPAHEEHGSAHLLHPGHEHLHFCRLHGVRHSESADGRFPTPQCLHHDPHGQRPPPVLWLGHAGQVSGHGVEEGVSHLRDVRRDLCPEQCHHPAGGGGSGLVLLLHHFIRSNLLGVQRRPGLSGGLRSAHQHQRCGLYSDTLITVLFLGQLEGREKQRSGWMGLGIALVCLLVLGSKNFILPALALIVLCVCLDGKREPKEREGSV